MAAPSSYKTLKGLLKATERTLALRHGGATRVDGQSVGMWLHNAQYCAEINFKGGASIRDLMAKYSVSRPQDLIGGHAVFGIPLPTRGYAIGDNVPSVGRVEDATDLQLCINGSWYHRSCFGELAA